mmetsp:Transcript_84389/g.149242  ORF Transcript_84389/g.149242 Transcript_84389/m.149242 type:complete len:672 (-) Transcript_84389:202-2217(-)|eukprot:CAMPEP_0197632190 /NCGR_PEP_ID=MMETSP1338-20131121/9056_1 /TAXON_ID=43686 ORGANISM="Pelagodinium beii, Strain RCC1491" /NCGR_SAMPLE_ID=MMETSP1338 /ASSEMBLY_ACC=CAM_ASM_000754 /LENGTH=671 /DNA_ID=CAMNT_0043203741 /DNA_START=63 /DNA_END=2078 /DNA_ORIENTATION=-
MEGSIVLHVLCSRKAGYLTRQVSPQKSMKAKALLDVLKAQLPFQDTSNLEFYLKNGQSPKEEVQPDVTLGEQAEQGASLIVKQKGEKEQGDVLRIINERGILTPFLASMTGKDLVEKLRKAHDTNRESSLHLFFQSPNRDEQLLRGEYSLVSQGVKENSTLIMREQGQNIELTFIYKDGPDGDVTEVQSVKGAMIGSGLKEVMKETFKLSAAAAAVISFKLKDEEDEVLLIDDKMIGEQRVMSGVTLTIRTKLSFMIMSSKRPHDEPKHYEASAGVTGRKFADDLKTSFGFDAKVPVVVQWDSRMRHTKKVMLDPDKVLANQGMQQGMTVLVKDTIEVTAVSLTTGDTETITAAPLSMQGKALKELLKKTFGYPPKAPLTIHFEIPHSKDLKENGKTNFPLKEDVSLAGQGMKENSILTLKHHLDVMVFCSKLSGFGSSHAMPASLTGKQVKGRLRDIYSIPLTSQVLVHFQNAQRNAALCWLEDPPTMEAQGIEDGASLIVKFDDKDVISPENSALRSNIKENTKSSYYYAHANETDMPHEIRYVAGGAPRQIEKEEEVGDDKPTKVISQYSWADEGDIVCLYISVEGDPEAVRAAGSGKNGQIDVSYDIRGVELRVKGEDKDYCLKLPNLANEIVADECKHRVSAGKRLTLKLKKKRKGTWTTLFAPKV